ncbi:hypothetical protein [Aureimonas sp. AU22]|uniref:hypothetical protein n=1 Tax=Aureimonas sp. AU22 TaxID=1638162 RepID=UPI000A498E8C|nr:hypothetical protein [Aureimonas sp. AU22]
MEADQTNVPARADDLWDEVVPYPMWVCVLIQVGGFLTIAAVIGGLGWSTVQVASWIIS